VSFAIKSVLWYLLPRAGTSHMNQVQFFNE
jgi:hypothetical protein